jgi:hypothetical protein
MVAGGESPAVLERQILRARVDHARLDVEQAVVATIAAQLDLTHVQLCRAVRKVATGQHHRHSI